MKRGYYLLAIIVIIFISCSNQGKKKEELKIAKTKFLTEDIFQLENSEFIALLSIKYNLPLDLTKKIVNEFKQKDLFSILTSINEVKSIEELEEFKNSVYIPSINDKINILCDENKVEPSLIASLIIDYRIFDKVNHADAY